MENQRPYLTAPGGLPGAGRPPMRPELPLHQVRLRPPPPKVIVRRRRPDLGQVTKAMAALAALITALTTAAVVVERLVGSP